ncbi:CotH kinase family protein [Isoptericola sp. NPDC019693]|uniref:CotH kinase family protein n=1 Tax=Isoptericola sp. NPDC019693 TaxID=3364009 RepID=UPI0037B66827
MMRDDLTPRRGRGPAAAGAHPFAPPRRLVAGAGAVALAGALSACGAPTSADDAGDFFDTSTVHTVAVEYDEDDYQEMLDTFADTGDKDWISATVTIDGEEYDDVGLRLKGNSSLRGLGGDGQDDQQAPGFDEGDGSASADDPAGLPWLIRLDKYVDGQEHDGRADLVVRGNTTESSLNEAVALQVLALAGVTAEQATYTRFSVNGGDEQLRLVVDLPDDDLWNEDNYPDGGITYKADADGDWGVKDDAAAYAESFEAKYDSTGGTDEEAYAPLAEFLELVNDSTDEEFAAHLGDHLDVDSFARYLAAQDLVANSDDIDGPGNNAYLHYDPDTGLMEVVAWDQNLSYGGMGGMGGMGGTGRPGGQGNEPPEGMEPPDGAELPDGAEAPDGQQAPPDGGQPEGFDPQEGGQGAPGGGFGGGNVLVTRFLENEDFAAAYESALEDLTTSVYDSGDAQDYLDAVTSTLSADASDLVDADTLESESQEIADLLTGDAVQSRADRASGQASQEGSSVEP